MSIRRIPILYDAPPAGFRFGTDPIVNGVISITPTLYWATTLTEEQRRAVCIGISDRSEVRAIQLRFRTTSTAAAGRWAINENVIYGTPVWVSVGQVFGAPDIYCLPPYGLTDGQLELLMGTQQEDFESMIFPPHSNSIVTWINEAHLNEAQGAETNYKYIASPIFPPSTNYRYVINYRRTAAGNIPGIRIYGCFVRYPFIDQMPVPAGGYVLQEQLLLDQAAGAVQHVVVDGAIDQYLLYKICFVQNGAAGNTDGSITIGPQP